MRCFDNRSLGVLTTCLMTPLEKTGGLHKLEGRGPFSGCVGVLVRRAQLVGVSIRARDFRKLPTGHIVSTLPQSYL